MIMIGIRDSDGRFWTAPGLSWDEAHSTARMWLQMDQIGCWVEMIGDNSKEGRAVRADLEADEHG